MNFFVEISTRGICLPQWWSDPSFVDSKGLRHGDQCGAALGLRAAWTSCPAARFSTRLRAAPICASRRAPSAGTSTSARTRPPYRWLLAARGAAETRVFLRDGPPQALVLRPAPSAGHSEPLARRRRRRGAARRSLNCTSATGEPLFFLRRRPKRWLSPPSSTRADASQMCAGDGGSAVDRPRASGAAG